jgi:hypothetical protein
MNIRLIHTAGKITRTFTVFLYVFELFDRDHPSPGEKHANIKERIDAALSVYQCRVAGYVDWALDRHSSYKYVPGPEITRNLGLDISDMLVAYSSHYKGTATSVLIDSWTAVLDVVMNLCDHEDDEGIVHADVVFDMPTPMTSSITHPPPLPPPPTTQSKSPIGTQR